MSCWDVLLTVFLIRLGMVWQQASQIRADQSIRAEPPEEANAPPWKAALPPTEPARPRKVGRPPAWKNKPPTSAMPRPPEPAAPGPMEGHILPFVRPDLDHGLN